mgnify:CR=1 FL=1
MEKTVVIGATIHVELQSHHYVPKPFPRDLHGLCYKQAGKDFPHVDNQSPVFHPYIVSWKRWDEGIRAVIAIQSIDEAFTSRAIHYFNKNKKIRLGKELFNVLSVDLKDTKALPTSIEEVKPVPSTFRIEFHTPTSFRKIIWDEEKNKKRGMSIAYPDMKMFVRSISKAIHQVEGIKTDIQQLNRIATELVPVSIEAHPMLVQFQPTQETKNAFVGEVKLFTGSMSLEDRKLLSLLVQWGEQMGVGHMKGAGFGKIKVFF